MMEKSSLKEVYVVKIYQRVKIHMGKCVYSSTKIRRKYARIVERRACISFAALVGW
jgi:hypothetical protein